MLVKKRARTCCQAAALFLIALAVSLVYAPVAWATGTTDVAATAVDDKVMIDSEAFYLTYNPSAPNLAESDIEPDGNWIFWGAQQTDALSDTLNYYTKTKASNNASGGTHIAATYRNVGELHSTGDDSWSEPVDIKVTFTITRSEGNPVYLSGEGWWNDWCDIKFHQRLTDGWTTTNMPEFEMVVEFYKAGTESKLNLNGSIWVLGQSLDDGEGFMVQNATAGYVSSDAPISNPDSGTVHPAVDANSKRHTIPRSHLYEIGALGTGWYGFIGAPVIYSADTTTWSQARDVDVFDDGGWWWQRKHGLNYIDRNGQGVDTSNPDNVVNSTSWKTLDGTTIENTFKWRSAALEAKLEAGTLKIKHYAIMKPDSSPAAANSAYGFNSAGMAADNSWDVRQAHLVASKFPEWGSFGFKYFTQLFAPQTAFVPHNPSKEVDKNRAEVGETVTYTIKQKVNDHGADCADGYTYQSLVFHDVLPEGLRFASLSIADSSGNDISSSGGTLGVGDDGRTIAYVFGKDYLLNNLAYDGGFITVTITADILPQAAGTTLVNSADFTFNDRYKRNTNEVETVVPKPDINIPTPTKAVDKEEAQVGDTVTYTIQERVIDKQGFPYSSLSFSDTLPDGLSFKSLKVETDGGSKNATSLRDITESAGKTSVDGQTIVYQFASEFLTNGGLAYTEDTLTFTIETTVAESAAGRTLENEAAVYVNDNELKTNKVVTIVPKPELAPPVKSVDKSEAHPGDALSYTIVQPLDDLPANFVITSLQFSDELPKGLDFTSLSVSDANGTDITKQAGSTNTDGNAITYSFDPEWLASAHPLRGSLTFNIAATIETKDPSAYGGVLVNDADTTFNNDYHLTSNEVQTRVTEQPTAPIPLPLTGADGISGVLSACTIVVLGCVMGLAIRLLRPRKQ